MANAFKCDVVNCPEMSEGVPPSSIIIEARAGTKKHLCQKHTDEIVKAYFPDLLPQPEPETVETAQPTEATA